jgi:hypothetical protein
MYLTLQDCMDLCELTEAEVLAIAEHEHVPALAAVQLGNYLIKTPKGEQQVKAMIRDDIAAAAASGDRLRAIALKCVLRDYILKHPCCEERHRAALFRREQRAS